LRYEGLRWKKPPISGGEGGQESQNKAMNKKARLRTGEK